MGEEDPHRAACHRASKHIEDAWLALDLAITALKQSAPACDAEERFIDYYVERLNRSKNEVHSIEWTLRRR